MKCDPPPPGLWSLSYVPETLICRDSLGHIPPDRAVGEVCLYLFLNAQDAVRNSSNWSSSDTWSLFEEDQDLN